MTWQIPWTISGVTEVPLTLARVMAFAATGGLEGVVNPTDLEVRANSTPNNSVLIRPGAFACLNRFASATNETYIGNNVGNDAVAIAATGGTARTDLVYAAIVDPGQPNNPANPTPVITKVIQNVSSTVKDLVDVPGYNDVSGYALALITMPANTSAVQQAYVKDLRETIFKQTSRVLRIVNIPDTQSDQKVALSTTNVFGLFPTSASWTIAVPIWAVRMGVVCTVSGLQVRGTTAQDYGGKMRVKAGSTYTSITETNFGITYGARDTANTMVAGDLAVPIADRGKNQTFRLEALKYAGLAETWASWGTAIVLDVTFYSTTESVG